ncbi:MAG: TrmH family RNA methyltransferase [Limisphaerales bacterium]|jgi:tRNA G18 (ribose-2'-O)-methylase SpoU|nr:RNA methyltransferase [Verrucomicrobiota bacterium]
MTRLRPVTSLLMPELEPYRMMKRSYDQHLQGIFIAEGEKVVSQLLRSRYRVLSALMPEKYYQRLQPLCDARREDFDIFLADKTLLKELTGYKYYQGVLAVGQIPARLSLQEAWERSPSPRFFMAVDELANPENLGTMIRNAAAFGVQTVIVGSLCCNPWLRRSVRSSVGNIFSINIVEGVEIRKAFAWLRSRSMQVIAAHPHAESHTLGSYQWPQGDLCLTFGSEGQGIPQAVLDTCSASVSIPMSNQADSINVACASATFLYDAWRLRQKPSPPPEL